jgi:hypothetical protein
LGLLFWKSYDSRWGWGTCITRKKKEPLRTQRDTEEAARRGGLRIERSERRGAEGAEVRGERQKRVTTEDTKSHRRRENP